MNPMMHRWKKGSKGVDESGTGRPETNEGVVKNSDNVRGTRQQKLTKSFRPTDAHTETRTHTYTYTYIYI